MAEIRPKRETSEEPGIEEKAPKEKKPVINKNKEKKAKKEKPRRKKLIKSDFAGGSDDGATGKKRAGALAGFLCGFLIMLILFVAAFGITYFDIFGSKTVLSGALGLSKTNEEARRAQETGFEQRSAELLSAESKLETRAAELDSREKQIAVRESELTLKTAALDQKETEIEDLRLQLKTQAAEFEETVKLLSSMDVTNAASIMMEMKDRDYVVRVLKAMKPKRTSEILAALDPKDASDLLTLMAARGGAE